MLYLILILLCVTSCRIVEIDDYIHDPTNDVRNALIWEHRSIKKVSKLTDEPVLLIPNLRTFTSSYSERSAKLILCSDTKKQILITEAVLINNDTGYKTSAKLDEEVVIDKKGYKNKEPFRTWIYLFRENTVKYSEYENAKNLTLEVRYRHHPYDDSSPVKVKTFDIHLKKKKDVAWPT